MHFDGYHFILETYNGAPSDPSNRIALEPPVIENLLMLRKKVYEDFQALSEKEKGESDDVQVCPWCWLQQGYRQG